MSLPTEFVWEWRLALARRIVVAGPFVLAKLEAVLLFDSEEGPEWPVPKERRTRADELIDVHDREQLSVFLAEVLVAYRMARRDLEYPRRQAAGTSHAGRTRQRGYR
jgi:hypothetical protein